MNPWRTEQGRRALDTRLRLLAGGRGELAEFAREVLAGRARPHDLLYSPLLDERTLAAIDAEIDRWHALPEAQRQAALSRVQEDTLAEIAALAALDPEPQSPAPPKDPDEGPSGGDVLEDAW